MYLKTWYFLLILIIEGVSQNIIFLRKDWFLKLILNSHHSKVAWSDPVQHILYMHSVVLSSLANKCKVDPARYMQQIHPGKITVWWCSKHLLHNNFSRRYPSRLSSSDIKLDQDTIHTDTIPWLINTTIRGAISLAVDVNTDTGNQLINVLNQTRSTWPQSHD